MPRILVICICFLFLAANTWVDGRVYDEEAIRRGNDYIDELLKDMFEDSDDYDPYKMDDSVVGFYKKVLFVNVSGEAKLHDGTIKGLRTLYRPNDCSLEDEGEELRVRADLGAGVLNFYYSGSAKFMNFGPTITVQGELAYIEVHIEFTVDAKTGKNGKLTKFIIDDMRGMKVWITGLGPINWALNPIISAVTKIFQRFVKNALENRVKKYIAERIPDYQFPVEGGSETEAPITTAAPQESTTQEKITRPPTRETVAPEKTETPVPEETETPVPEETETPVPEETETPVPEETDTPIPEETTQPSETPTSVPEEEIPTEES